MKCLNRSQFCALTRAVRTLPGITASLFSLNASAWEWSGPNHGYQINVNAPAEGLALKDGTNAHLTGSVSLIQNSSGDDESVSTALSGDGVQLKFFFPDLTTEVTKSVQVSSSGGGLGFSFLTPTLSAQALNTLTVQVIHSSDEVAELQQTQAKVDQRILILQDMIAKEKDSKRLASLKQSRDQLASVSAKISAQIAAKKVLVAERKYPLIVGNRISQSGSAMSLIGGFQVSLSYDVGLAFQGQATSGHGKVTRILETGSEKSWDWQAKFYWQGTESKVFQLSSFAVGQSVAFDLSTGKLNPGGNNSFGARVYQKKSTGNGDGAGTTKLYAEMFLTEPVAGDAVAPKWLTAIPSGNIGALRNLSTLQGTLIDELGLIDSSTLTSSLDGWDKSGTAVHRSLNSLLSTSVPDQGQTLNVSADLTRLNIDEGSYTISTQASDLAGNASTSWATAFVTDRTPPSITVGYGSGDGPGQLTPAVQFAFDLTVNDYSPTSTKILVNGTQVQELQNQISYTQRVQFLLTEGVNSIEIQSTDAAGNQAQPVVISRVLDTTPPTLTVNEPKDGKIYSSVNIPISGKANEPLSSITVNSQPLTLGPDQMTFTGTYTAPAEGQVQIQIAAADLVGNFSQFNAAPIVILRVLNLNLLSVVPDSTNGYVLVRGAKGATRPGDTVSISAGILNSTSLTSGDDGSFTARMPLFQKAMVTSYDPSLNRSESAEVTFGQTNVYLAGQVRDTDDKPISGVTVSLASGIVTPVVTDATGTFAFAQPASGDQILVIDGTTVPLLAPPAPQRRFSRTNISISIGLTQSNVLQRPVYLTPIPMDGSATVVDAQAGGVVTHPSAPGVQLKIPAESATFPDGSTSGAVSMATISAKVTTMSPMAFASPEKVVALEPSGMSFSEPVPLTLPNETNLQPGVEMVILSMNSQKGIWEIDGAAKVSDDGRSVVTKPGMGITHFSTVYAAPIGPTVLPIGSQDAPGADTFSGAMSTSVKLPTYKLLGKDVGPSLIYKSTWAKPTAVVSNLFDIPRHEVNISKDEDGHKFIKVPVCVVFCWDQPVDMYWNVSVRGQAWYVPDYITAQFTTATVISDKLKFTGVPNRAKISFATDLIDPSSNEYLPTGM